MSKKVSEKSYVRKVNRAYKSALASGMKARELRQILTQREKYEDNPTFQNAQKFGRYLERKVKRSEWYQENRETIERNNIVKEFNVEKQKSRYRYYGRGVKNTIDRMVRETGSNMIGEKVNFGFPYWLNKQWRKLRKLKGMSSQEIQDLIKEMKAWNQNTRTPEMRKKFAYENAVIVAVISHEKHGMSDDRYDMVIENIVKQYMWDFDVDREEAEKWVEDKINKQIDEMYNDINNFKQELDWEQTIKDVKEVFGEDWSDMKPKNELK